VLETIRDLMNAHCVVPEWLHDIFLGYGDPGAAHYSRMDALATLDFNDTFLDLEHLKSCFPDRKVEVRPCPDGIGVGCNTCLVLHVGV
jgi:intron-binding protein aquarius